MQFNLVNITFRRKPWKFSKIYAKGGGVVEGVEDVGVSICCATLQNAYTTNELF